jgi:hypothetical protein
MNELKGCTKDRPGLHTWVTQCPPFCILFCSILFLFYFIMTVHSILLLSILSAFLQNRWWNGPTNAIQLPAMLKVDKYYSCYQTSWVWAETKLALTFIVKQKPRKHYFKYNQQDATVHNILYYCQCSTCFGRFFRPSSGAQELYTQHLVCARLACCYR